MLETNPPSVPARIPPANEACPGSIARASGVQKNPANAASGATHATFPRRNGLISLPIAFYPITLNVADGVNVELLFLSVTFSRNV